MAAASRRIQSSLTDVNAAERTELAKCHGSRGTAKRTIAFLSLFLLVSPVGIDIARTMRAKSELKSVNAKLAEEEKKLKQQHLENKAQRAAAWKDYASSEFLSRKAKAQEISKETAQMDATKKNESTMKRTAKNELVKCFLLLMASLWKTPVVKLIELRF